MTKPLIVIGNKRYSSWSLRGWLAVEHTGMPYDEIMLPLDTPSFYQEIEKYSPAKRVPTLINGADAVWDSAAIIDYCARLAPEKFWWPEEMSSYGHARSLFNEMHSGFTEIRTHMPMNLRDRWQNLTFSEKLQAELNRVEDLFSSCRETYGKEGKFLFGGFSAVDMMYAPLVTRLNTYGIPLNNTAQAYVKSVLTYEPMKKWIKAGAAETTIVKVDQVAADARHLGD